MKNAKKFLLALLLVAAVVCGIVVTVFAAYTGDLQTAASLLDNVEKISNSKLQEKVNAMQKVGVYMKTVDPKATGYADFAARYDAVDLAVAKLVLSNSGATSDNAKVVTVYEFLAKAPFLAPDKSEGVGEFLSEIASYAFNAYKAFCADATGAVISPAKTARDILDAYNELKGLAAGTGDDVGPEREETLTTMVTGNTSGLISDYASLRDTMKELHKITSTCTGMTSYLDADDKAEYDTIKKSVNEIEANEVRILAAIYCGTRYSNLDVIDKDSYITLFRTANELFHYYATYISLSSFTFDEFAELTGCYNEVKADMNKVRAQKKAEVEFTTPLIEYTWNDGQLSYDFDDGKFSRTLYHSGAQNGSSMAVVTGGGRRYLELTLGLSKSEVNTDKGEHGSEDAYFEFVLGDTSYGYVVEFDMMTPDDSLPYTIFQNAEDSLNNAGRVFCQYFYIKDNSVYIKGSEYPNGSLVAENVFTPGEWVHFALCYTPDNGNGQPAASLYLNDQLIADWYEAKCAHPYKWTTLRVLGNCAHTTICYDNFQMYQGTTPRDRDRFGNGEQKQMFKFYVEVFMNEKYSTYNRSYAATQAMRLLPYMDENDPDLKESIENCGKTEIIEAVHKAARDDTYAKLIVKVEKLKPEEATTANIAAKTNDLESIEKFMVTNADYISPTEERIVEARKVITALTEKLDRLKNLQQLVYSLQRFDRATTYSAMSRHSVTVNECYQLCGFEEEAAYLEFAGDPMVMNFESKVKKTIPEYFDDIATVVYNSYCRENSARVVDCMQFVTEMEGYERTEEFWTENYAYINKYILIVREVIHSEDFDETYEGFEEAWDEFRIADLYFYGLLQEEHASKIKAQLDKYPLTQSYIERLGICTYISKYIEDNDVDRTNDSIIPLLQLHKVYEEEMKSQESAYAAVIEQNTEYFIAAVNKLGSVSGYSAMKPLYEEALGYFYGMNIDSEEAQAAVERFYEYQSVIEEVDNNSTLFNGYCRQLARASSTRDIYQLLVKCASVVDGVSEDISGVSESLATYESKLNVYNNRTASSNAIVAEVNGIVCSVRAITVHEAVLQVVENLMVND